MIERNPGLGWTINSFLHDDGAHIQRYRFRMATEPAALLEPTYKVNAAAFAKARAIQQRLLDGDIFTLPRPQLFQIGSQLHELIAGCSGNAWLRPINQTGYLPAIRHPPPLSGNKPGCSSITA